MHPTLGSVDNICFSPLGDESLENVSVQAVDFSAKLNEFVGVPVFHYGGASVCSSGSDSSVPVQLKDIRRQLGYFEESSSIKLADTVPTLQPTFGNFVRSAVRDSKGVSCVGAVPYIQNLNICFGNDSPRSLVVKVTAAVRIPNVVSYSNLNYFHLVFVYREILSINTISIY